MPASAVTAIVVFAVWVLCGVVAAVVMSRSGRPSGLWYVITVLLGPLSLPIALDMSRERPVEVVERVTLVAPGGGSPQSTAAGTVRVLVGIDGSAEAQQAFSHAVDLLGGRICALVLVHVLDYDSAVMDGDEATRRGHQILERALASVGTDVVDPTIEVAVGRPADALIDLVHRESADLLVLGQRGHGMSRSVFGSVSNEAARRSPCPVLVGAGRRQAA